MGDEPEFTARLLFRVGDRVRVSPIGVAQRISPRCQHATVVGFGRESQLVRVLRDGNKCPTSYHYHWWVRQ